MSANSNFIYTQKISQAATPLVKLTEVTSRYMELPSFKAFDIHSVYFCYNCIYFMNPNNCTVVTYEGQDANGNVSGVIGPHAKCSLWISKWKSNKVSKNLIKKFENVFVTLLMNVRLLSHLITILLSNY
jgi:hypothetical protein